MVGCRMPCASAPPVRSRRLHNMAARKAAASPRPPPPPPSPSTLRLPLISRSFWKLPAEDTVRASQGHGWGEARWKRESALRGAEQWTCSVRRTLTAHIWSRDYQLVVVDRRPKAVRRGRAAGPRVSDRPVNPRAGDSRPGWRLLHPLPGRRRPPA